MVDTPRGVLRAAEVLLATNGYGGAESPDLRRRVLPVGSYIIATPRSIPPVVARLIPQRRMVSDTRNHLVYFRFSPEGRMIFGGRASFVPTSTVRAAGILAREMGDTFPELAGLPAEYCWSGRVGFTRDQLPHVATLGGVHSRRAIAATEWRCPRFWALPWGGRLRARAIGLPWRTSGSPPFHSTAAGHGSCPPVGAYYRLKDWLR